VLASHAFASLAITVLKKIYIKTSAISDNIRMCKFSSIQLGLIQN